ncbi:MAG: LysR substrate-binding domain-containing protein [Dethiobacteria bacterium]|jgi:DNA-binding transcriptional LysR family regulator
MDFHQLRIFIEVARQKSFSRAAEKIFLTQPTVSAHIKALENEVGTPLLDRDQRELQLTGAGKVLFQYAQQLLGIKEKALFAIQKEYRIIKGHLEIAASSVPGAYILPGLMQGFLEKYPGVTFAVMLRDTRQVYESISDYTYDLGFVGEPARPDGLAQIKLLKDELVLVAAPGTCLPGEKPSQIENSAKGKKKQEMVSVGRDSSSFPEHRREPVFQLFELVLTSGTNREKFLQTPFIMREPGSATRDVFENALQRFYGQKEVALNVVVYLESQEAIKEAVKTGLGVTVISRRAVKEELANGLLKGYRLPDLLLARSFYLIYRKNRIFSPLSQAFLDHCVNHFAAADEENGP